MFEAVLGDSIIGRARENGLLELNLSRFGTFPPINTAAWTTIRMAAVRGMLMSVQPIYDAYKSIVDGLSYKPLTIYLSPQGKVFDQSCAAELAVREHVVFAVRTLRGR